MAKTPRQRKKSSTKAKCSPVPSNLDRYPPEPCDIAFGWTMKSIPRKSKKQSDHYYFNPEGDEMFRSRKEVKRYLNLKAATKSTRTAVLTPQATEKKPAKPKYTCELCGKSDCKDFLIFQGTPSLSARHVHKDCRSNLQSSSASGTAAARMKDILNLFQEVQENIRQATSSNGEAYCMVDELKTVINQQLDALVDTLLEPKVAKGSTEENSGGCQQKLPRGVTRRSFDKWQAQIWCSGQSRYIGTFDSPEKASIAYETARLFLERKKNGRPIPLRIIEKALKLAREKVASAGEGTCQSMKTGPSDGVGEPLMKTDPTPQPRGNAAAHAAKPEEAKQRNERDNDQLALVQVGKTNEEANADSKCVIS